MTTTPAASFHLSQDIDTLKQKTLDQITWELKQFLIVNHFNPGVRLDFIEYQKGLTPADGNVFVQQNNKTLRFSFYIDWLELPTYYTIVEMVFDSWLIEECKSDSLQGIAEELCVLDKNGFGFCTTTVNDMIIFKSDQKRVARFISKQKCLSIVAGVVLNEIGSVLKEENRKRKSEEVQFWREKFSNDAWDR